MNLLVERQLIEKKRGLACLFYQALRESKKCTERRILNKEVLEVVAEAKN